MDEHAPPSPVARFVPRRPGAPPHATPGRVLGADAGVFGPLAELVREAAVTDIFVNATGRVWVDRGRGLEAAATLGLDEPQVRELAVRLVAQGGRHIDEASPCVDVRLHDGMRIHAVLPPVSPEGTLLSIRLPGVAAPGLFDLARSGFFVGATEQAIRQLLERRANLLITGAGGCGKTTFLAAMLAAVSSSERIIAIEDVAELRVAHPHFVSLEARQPNLEGAGEVGLSRLVREALRMRPDRLVVGECRGAEIRELLAALNTGHDGGAGTLHANSLADVPSRLEALGALAGMTDHAVARQTVSAIDAVLHLRRDGDRRYLSEWGSFATDPDGRLSIRPRTIDGHHEME